MNQAWRILSGLAAGLALGAVWDWAAWPGLDPTVTGRLDHGCRRCSRCVSADVAVTTAVARSSRS